MKINFIRHISDDILRENHQLKTTIVTLKQQLQNFQSKMMTFISEKDSEAPVISTPEQTLNSFIKLVNCKLYDFKNQIVKKEIYHQRLIEDSQEIKKREISCKKIKELSFKQQIEKCKKQYQSLQKRTLTFTRRQQQLKNELVAINQKFKTEKNIIEEVNRKQIQNVKLYHHNRFMELREQMQNQHLVLQKKLNNQLAEKDKRIKQLQKIIEKLSANLSLNHVQIESLANVLQGFQQAHKSRKLIEQLRQQNLAIKRMLSDLQTEKMGLQSKLIESKIIQHNLQTEIEHQKLERIQFQNKLSSKIKQIEDSEKDKEAIEEYYTRKWNSQYGKVRAHLEKAFTQKSESLQQSYTSRMKDFQSKILEWKTRMTSIQVKNKDLQRIHEDDKDTKSALRKKITQTKQMYEELLAQQKESVKMSQQQILAIQLIKEQQLELSKRQIYTLKKQLKDKQKDIQKHSQLLQSKVDHLLQEEKLKMVQQKVILLDQFEGQKLKMKTQFDRNTEQLKEQLKNKDKMMILIKEEMRQQNQLQIQTIKKINQSHIKQKEDQYLKKIQKLTHKLKDYEHKILNSKKINDEVSFTFERQKVTFQKQIQSLNIKIFNLEQTIKTHINAKNDMYQETELLYKRIQSLQLIINDKNQEIQSKAQQHQIAINKSEYLTAQRCKWEEQLRTLQKGFKEQFEALKRTSDMQINLYKSKIWELQMMNKKNVISKKNYNKLQELNTEKLSLKNALQIKQAENIVLAQVRDFYESQLRLSQSKITNNQQKGAKFIFSRKIDRYYRLYNKKNLSMHQQSKELERLQPKEVVQMKKYIAQSQKKQQTLTLSKTGYREIVDFDRIRTDPL